MKPIKKTTPTNPWMKGFVIESRPPESEIARKSAVSQIVDGNLKNRTTKLVR